MEVSKGVAKEIKSDLVEGLGLRVELTGRRIYLKVDNGEVTTEWLPSSYFADWLDISKTRVDTIIRDLNIEGKFDKYFNTMVYPPLTFELVAEECLWKQKYSELGTITTTAEAGELLGRDYRYVSKKAAEFGCSPRRGKLAKVVLRKIRAEELNIPYDEGWYTLRGLAESVKKDREWVGNRLKELGIIPEKRRSLKSGIALKYYPPETLNLVMECVKKIPKYGEDWYTCCRICQETGKSLHWVSNRLVRYKNCSQLRLDDMNVSRIHYPKNVFDILLAQAELDSPKSNSDGWLTIKEVADILGIDEKSTSRKLNSIGLIFERRKTAEGRVVRHYNPIDIAKITEESQKYIDLSSLSRKIGKSAYVICSTLDKMGIGSIKSCYDFRPKKLYPLEVIELLKNE